MFRRNNENVPCQSLHTWRPHGKTDTQFHQSLMRSLWPLPTLSKLNGIYCLWAIAGSANSSLDEEIEPWMGSLFLHFSICTCVHVYIHVCEHTYTCHREWRGGSETMCRSWFSPSDRYVQTQVRLAGKYIYSLSCLHSPRRVKWVFKIKFKYILWKKSAYKETFPTVWWKGN